MDISVKLMPNNGQAVSQLEYSKVVGYLMYVMIITRHGIAFVVGNLSRFSMNPSTHHWQAERYVLKSLKKTMGYGLTYVGFPYFIERYFDASWNINIKYHYSISGWVSFLENVISWASKKQTCIKNQLWKIYSPCSC